MPNPYLKPETSKSFEVALEQYLALHLQVSVSGFRDSIRGLISQEAGVLPSTIIYRNSRNVDLTGWDAELDRKSARGFDAGIGVSFQSAEAENGPELSNAPRQLGVAHLSVPLFNGKLFASANAQHVGRRRTLQGNFTKGYVVPNFTLFSRSALRGWEFSASLYNAFDTQYGDPGAEEHVQDILYQDGRNFRLKFTYRF